MSGHRHLVSGASPCLFDNAYLHFYRRRTAGQYARDVVHWPLSADARAGALILDQAVAIGQAF